MSRNVSLHKQGVHVLLQVTPCGCVWTFFHVCSVKTRSMYTPLQRGGSCCASQSVKGHLDKDISGVSGVLSETLIWLLAVRFLGLQYI